jgi:hypothetical protein
VECHDLGYSLDFADLPQGFEQRMKKVWMEIGKANNYAPEYAEKIADDLWNFILENKGNYVVGKIMAHGTLSIPLAMERLTASGFTEKESLGYALLFAAHHPGYPITMVEEKVVKFTGVNGGENGEIPVQFLPFLMINDVKDGKRGTEGSKQDEENQTDQFRLRMSAYASDLADILPLQGHFITLLDFAYRNLFRHIESLWRYLPAFAKGILKVCHFERGRLAVQSTDLLPTKLSN